MILVAGAVRIRPERRDEAVRVALAMAEATRAEPGCRQYAFYADLQAPDTFFVFEEWDSEEALARHFETPHMAEFQAKLPALLAGPLDIPSYVARKRPRG
jgi:quinol monooxygenase YgiN